ncbi:MAG TPA: hypothetical protein VLT84_09400 [Acidobacteriota bacterium]|nr:hypothetical protein [Acidobacteriota bacterium]
MERPAILDDVSPASLADAAARSLQALNRFLGRSPRTEVSEVAGLYRWRTHERLGFRPVGTIEHFVRGPGP